MRKNLLSLLLMMIAVSANVVDSEAKVTLDDLWDGNAVFVPTSKVHFWKQFSDYFQHGSALIVHEGVWYLFLRGIVNRGPESDFAKRCGTVDEVLAAVSESPDKGKTWSKPVMVGRLGAPYCGPTDYAIARHNEKWHLLAQCHNPQKGWHTCYLSSDKKTPSEAFEPSSINPSISPKQLWNPICQQTGAGCSPGSVYDEGTPQIIKYENGNYYVSFHGYGTDNIRGYRGMAKTPDFKNWTTIAPDLPKGAVLTQNDCTKQIPGCIGGGYGYHLQTASYTYLYIETPTKNLGCTDGQRWPFTLYRSSKFNAKTGEWQAWSRNPLLENNIRNPNAWAGGCHMQYSFIFEDGEDTYMFVNYLSNMVDGVTYPSMILKLLPLAGNETKEVRIITDAIDQALSYANTYVKPLTFANTYQVFEGSDPALKGVVGKQVGSNAITNVLGDNGYLINGPSLESLPKEKYTANFILRFFQNYHETLPVATIDVYDKNTGEVLATRMITGLEGLDTDQAANYPLKFDLTARGLSKIAFRVLVHGNAMVEVDKVALVKEITVPPVDDACASARPFYKWNVQ